jgi:hypothetical protein
MIAAAALILGQLGAAGHLEPCLNFDPLKTSAAGFATHCDQIWKQRFKGNRVEFRGTS